MTRSSGVPDMSDFYLFEAQPCDEFAFENAVEEFDPNVLPIVGPAGPQGPQGPTGPAGGVDSVDGKTGKVSVLPAGGSAGQVLKKSSGTDYDVEWGTGGGGSGTVTAEDAGSVSPPSPFVLSVSEGGTGANNAAGARANLGIDEPLEASAAFAIPASGSSVSYDMAGMTEDYELIRWNFSSSAENTPPVALEWHTYAGYFTITNNGGTTSETMRPMFAKPKSVAITTH